MFYSLSYDKDFREPVWRERSLLLGSCIYVSNSSLTAFMIPTISTSLDEGSDTFILARHKEVFGLHGYYITTYFVPVSQTVGVHIALYLVLLDY